MKKTISVRNIDTELWRQFRSVCIVQSKTVPEKLEEIMIAAIAEDQIEPELIEKHLRVE